MALTHLALAGVGRLDDPREDARRLFIADGLMKGGVAPATILEALGAGSSSEGLDRAYNPDQPRVPAGNGRPSGQWTTGESSGTAGATIHSDGAPTLGAQVADESSTRGREVRSDASPTPPARSAPEKPSILYSLLTGLLKVLPGTHYSALAVQAWHGGDYLNFALYEGAATLEAALILAPAARAVSTGAEAVPAEAAAALRTLTVSDRRAIQLAANKLAGKAWEATAQSGIEDAGLETFPQVTVETGSGARYIADFITRDPETGTLGCVECKASSTASFTPRQRVAIPDISQSGATVVTPDIPGVPRGTRVPPSGVQILVGPEWPPTGWSPQR